MSAAWVDDFSENWFIDLRLQKEATDANGGEASWKTDFTFKSLDSAMTMVVLPSQSLASHDRGDGCKKAL